MKLRSRRGSFLIALLAFTVAALAGASVATAAEHFVGDPSCDVTGNNTRTASVDCSGKVAGFGNEPVPLYVVISGPAGCSNPGNDDIPGQRRFVSGPFSPNKSGNVLFGDEDPTGRNKVGGRVSCHGGQEAFIGSPLTLSIYTCTSGAPTFSKKTGQQTNRSCTLQDTATV